LEIIVKKVIKISKAGNKGMRWFYCYQTSHDQIRLIAIAPEIINLFVNIVTSYRLTVERKSLKNIF
jgi:hypothetical protein